MSIKLKALGLGLLATMAIGAFAVMNASATTGGHFVSDVAHTEIKGMEDKNVHQLEFTFHGLSGGIICDTVSYSATTTVSTVTELLVTPSYAGCHTTGEAAGTVTVSVNGCKYRFTVAPGGNETEHTVHLECPAGQGILVTHPNCEVRITPQTINTGLTYTRTTNAFTGRHEITLESSLQFNIEYHGSKICVLTGTNHVGTLKGSATVQGFNTEGAQVNVTAT
jgi:hypothetical protein